MMRTTLTIDDDIAAELEALRRARRLSLKAAVNDALRRGLADLREGRQARVKPFKTKSFDAGGLRLPLPDSVAEMLALAEGEDFR
jgi:hypothetical protein